MFTTCASGAPLRLLLLLVTVCLVVPLSSAQSTSNPTPSTTSPASATSTYDVFSAIASAHGHGGTSGRQPGAVAAGPTNAAGDNAAGASGSDQSLNLNNGVIIGISVAVGIAAIIGSKHNACKSSKWLRQCRHKFTKDTFATTTNIRCLVTSGVLFYLAHKKRWDLRASMRASIRTRRLTIEHKPRPYSSSALMFRRKAQYAIKLGSPRTPPPKAKVIVRISEDPDDGWTKDLERGKRGSDGSVWT